MKQDEKRKKVTQKGGGDKIQHSFKLIQMQIQVLSKTVVIETEGR